MGGAPVRGNIIPKYLTEEVKKTRCGIENQVRNSKLIIKNTRVTTHSA